MDICKHFYGEEYEAGDNLREMMYLLTSLKKLGYKATLKGFTNSIVLQKTIYFLKVFDENEYIFFDSENGYRRMKYADVLDTVYSKGYARCFDITDNILRPRVTNGIKQYLNYAIRQIILIYKIIISIRRISSE